MGIMSSRRATRVRGQFKAKAEAAKAAEPVAEVKAQVPEQEQVEAEPKEEKKALKNVSNKRPKNQNS